MGEVTVETLLANASGQIYSFPGFGFYWGKSMRGSRLAFLLSWVVLATASAAWADYVELQRYNEQASLRLSGGRSRQCGGWGFDSDRPLRIRDVQCLDIDGLWRSTSQMINLQTDAYQVRWSNKSPYQMIDGRNFFSSLQISLSDLSVVLARKGGSKPIFLPVTAFLARDRATGDYLVPFCFSARPGCGPASERMDGIVDVRRSAAPANYTVRDLGDGRQEYCIVAGLRVICDISQYAPLQFGDPGRWARASVANGSVNYLDSIVIGISNFAKVPEAVRLRELAEARAAWQRSELAQRAADQAACEAYQQSGAAIAC